MTNGEVKESLLVSQASNLIATTIAEIERLRSAPSSSGVYPHGIGNVSVRIKVGDEAVELNVGSAETFELNIPAQAKLTMIYRIEKSGSGTNAATTTHVRDATGTVLTLIADNQEHSVAIGL